MGVGFIIASLLSEDLIYPKLMPFFSDGGMNEGG